MRFFPYLFLPAILLSLSGCFDPNPDNYQDNESGPSPEPVRPLTSREKELNMNCGFDEFLSDPKTPVMAKELFQSSYAFGSDKPLELFDKLTDKRPYKRLFYFKVITKISDGYYSPELGRKTTEYIQDHPKDFAAYFDHEGCVTETDMQTWVDNVTAHLRVAGPQTNYDDVAADFNAKLFAGCKDCSEQQQATIGRFAELLEEKWGDYLAGR
jgi:hypothetical protein